MITIDDYLSLALLTGPHVGHCTTSTFDSSHRTASSSIGPEKESMRVLVHHQQFPPDLGVVLAYQDDFLACAPLASLSCLPRGFLAAGVALGEVQAGQEQTRILRNFADNGKKHIRWERADVLRKPNGCFDLL